MIGLVILIVGVIYVAALFFVTRFAYRWAKARGLTKGKCWLVGAGGFLLVYLPVFWDHIPTVVAHKYYCEKEAGFWVYKTAEQWKKENPGVAEILVAEGRAQSYRRGGMENYTDTDVLNQRFNSVGKKMGPLPQNRWRWEQEIVDSNTGEVLARSVDFSTGNGFVGGANWPLKFWLQSGFCKDGGVYAATLNPIREAFKNIGMKE